MTGNISFLTYGRQTMGSSWYIAPIRGVCRLYYLHSGTVTYRSEIEERLLHPGMLYLFPQNLTFRLITDETTLVDHTYFDFFAVPAVFKETVIALPLADHPLIRAGFSVLAELAEQHPFPGIPETDTYYRLTAAYLGDLLALIRAEVGLPTVEDADIRFALEYIHEHYNEDISVGELASRFHLEINVFIRKFKRYTNVTPYQYIKNHRVNVALSLLRNGTHSLADAAEACGYADASSLSHAIHSLTKEKLLG